MHYYVSQAVSAARQLLNMKGAVGVVFDLVALFGVPVLISGAAVHIGVDPGGAQALGIVTFLSLLAYDTVRFSRWLRLTSGETKSCRRFRRQRSQLGKGEE